MIEIFSNLIYVGKTAGIVTSAVMYDSGFMTVDGKTKEGKNFHITMSIKEEETDGN